MPLPPVMFVIGNKSTAALLPYNSQQGGGAIASTLPLRRVHGDFHRLNPIRLKTPIRKLTQPVTQSIKTLSLIQSQYVRLAQKPLDFWVFSHFGAPKERCPATLYL